MNIKARLENEHSKKQTTEIVNWIGNHQDRFDGLLQLFLTGEYRVIQRAAWPLSYAAIQHPQLMQKHYKKILARLEAPGQPAAVKRNILRILDQVPEIPELHHGIIMDACFRYIQDPAETIASRAFALGILQKLSKIYPEILPELKTIIESHLPHVTAAFRSRARKILGYSL